MTLFLIGPSSNYFDGNRKGFSLAAEALRKAGNTVINPLEVLEAYNGDWRMVYKSFLDCQAVAALPGWDQELWCHTIRTIAHQLDISVINPTTQQTLENPATQLD